MAHDERSPHGGSRHRKDDAGPAFQRPWRRHLSVTLADQRRAGVTDVTVEDRQQLSAGGCLQGRRVARQVELVLRQRDAPPARYRRDVLRQLAERHRLLMRLPVELTLRHAFEELPGNGHLVIELGEQRVGNAHGYFVCCCVPKLTRGTRSASGGALNNGYSLKPKMPAVTFDGNCLRDVL